MAELPLDKLERVERIKQNLPQWLQDGAFHTIAGACGDLIRINESFHSALAKCREETVAECAKAIPTSWLDSILSGKTAALSSARLGKWGCDDIERALSAIRDRIRALASTGEG